MPIAVMCPSCSASFSVKDELAGKRAKCPKCAEPLTIPDGAPVAPTPTPAVAVPASVAKPVARPVAARPVAVPVKPTDDEDDRPKGKKQRDNEEEDDRPRGKKRRGDDDADGDKTKAKRRRRDDDDDDQPKKKGKALPIILGILGGVILLCGGGCAGGWFFWLKPNLEAAASNLNAWATDLDKNKPNQEKQRPAEEPPVVTMEAKAFYKLPEGERKQYDKKWVQLTGPVPTVHIDSYPNKPEDGWIELGSAKFATITCNFGPTEWAAKPKFDDEKDYTVIGLCEAGAYMSKLTWCRVVSEAEREPATKVDIGILLADPSVYLGKMVEVEGIVQSAKFERGTITTVLTGIGGGKGVRFGLPPDKREVKAGDRLKVKGKVERDQTGAVDLNFRKIVSHTPGSGPGPQDPPSDPNGPVVTTADAMIQSYIKDVTSPDRLYMGKQIKLTGKVADINGPILYFGGQDDSNYTFWVQVNLTGTTAVKKGDIVTVVAKYQSFATSLTNGTRTITLTDGKLDGNIAAPPKTDPKSDDLPIIVSANILLDEYVKDPKKADEKYKGKLVQISGTVKSMANRTSINLNERVIDKYTCHVTANVTGGIPDTVKEKGRVAMVGRVRGLEVDDQNKQKVLVVDDCKLTK